MRVERWHIFAFLLLQTQVVPHGFSIDDNWFVPVTLDLLVKLLEEHLALLPVLLIRGTEEPSHDGIVSEGLVQTLEPRRAGGFDSLLEEFDLFRDVAEDFNSLLLDGVQIEDGLGFGARFVQLGVTRDLFADAAYLCVQVDSGAHDQNVIEQTEEVKCLH